MAERKKSSVKNRELIPKRNDVVEAKSKEVDRPPVKYFGKPEHNPENFK
jgi:hypothetical protein